MSQEENYQSGGITKDHDLEIATDQTETVAGTKVVISQDEEVLYNIRQSWWNWPVWTLLGFCTGIGLLIPWYFRKHTRYILTTKRIIKCEGIFETEVTQFLIRDLRQARIEASFWDRMRRLGTINLDTYAETAMELKAVPRHKTVANTIREQINR